MAVMHSEDAAGSSASGMTQHAVGSAANGSSYDALGVRGAGRYRHSSPTQAHTSAPTFDAGTCNSADVFTDFHGDVDTHAGTYGYADVVAAAGAEFNTDASAKAGTNLHADVDTHAGTCNYTDVIADAGAVF